MSSCNDWKKIMRKPPYKPEPSSTDLNPPNLRGSTQGTARYRDRFASRFEPDFFRPTSLDLTVSSIGIGTYLGEPTEDDDEAYANTILRAITCGINLIDTAINYRCQRSEVAVGAAIQEALDQGLTTRESLVVCTKGGYVPLEQEPPPTREAYQEYLRREFLDPQVFRPDDLVAGGHCLAPRFLRFCIAKSRQNLGLRTIDLYYLHNPEQQLTTVTSSELRERLRAAFTVLEESVSRGDIGAYGCATWNGFRISPQTKGHLSLEEIVTVAREVAGEKHHFRAVQLPINLAMPEAVRMPTQSLDGRLVTPLEAAAELGVTVVASASLMQARLTSGLPDAVRELFPKCETDAQRAIAFTRTINGVTAALFGTRHAYYVDENLGCARA
jgi:aryl-alcohol dehydrogenase-like predicted oxidoreductase